MSRKTGIRAISLVAASLLGARAVQGQNVVYSWTWSEVLANSATPSSATPGVIDPTEGVRLSLTAAFSPAVGSPITYTGGPGPGHGTVAGWGSTTLVFEGAGGAAGDFSLPTAAMDFTIFEPTIVSPSSILISAASWGLYFSVGPVNQSNPVVGLISFTWTPMNYSARSVSFTSHDAVVDPFANGIGIRYGTGGSGQPLYWVSGVPADHGPGTGPIPIVPAPGVLAVVGLGLLQGRRWRMALASPH